MQRLDGMVSRIAHALSQMPHSSSDPAGDSNALLSESFSGQQGMVAAEQVVSEQPDSGNTAAVTDLDRAILGRVEKTLADGLALKRWWEQTDSSNSYANRFKVVREFNRSDASFGFFDRVTIDGRTLPIMGTVDESLFDQPKQAVSGRLRNEFREFVLHYFLRISAYQEPEVYTETGRPVISDSLHRLSWCPEPRRGRIGFGFSQHYYKLRGSGVVGKFSPKEEFAIIDLREIGEKYEWIVLKVRIFGFNLTFRLLGSDQARVVLPLNEETYLVLNRDLVLNEEDSESGVLGKYGFGYAFIRNPKEGLFAYGPGQFDAAVELINFYMLQTGETRAHLVFIANRPEKILNVPISPFDWSFALADLTSFGLASTVVAPIKGILDLLPLPNADFDPVSTYVSLANRLTGGLAARELCISREQLEKDFLAQHFMQHYQMIVGSVLTWRRIRDWLDSQRLPDWVITGVNS